MTETMGILAYGAHVPYRRLDRAAISDVMGSGGGQGWRSVASFDQDTTTMGVEAARQALAATDLDPEALWFSTVAPAYLAKTAAAGFAIWTVLALVFAPGILGSLPHEAGLAVLIAAVVNLHHFVLDGVVWKLRDSHVARVLLREVKQPTSSAGPTRRRRWPTA